MRQVVLAPGKRVRPVLTVLVGRELGCRAPGLLDAGCALEMVHAASLILDDLPCMDNATLRRGAPAAHIRFGEDATILAAVSLLGRAFGVLSSAQVFPTSLAGSLAAILANAVGVDGLADGQFQDLRLGLCDPSPERVRLINRRKTGALFVAAVELAACVAEVRDKRLVQLRDCAEELGQAFQIINDMLDGASPTDILRAGAASHHRRPTLIAVMGYEKAESCLERHIETAIDLARCNKRSGILDVFLREMFDALLALCEASHENSARKAGKVD